MTDFLGLHGLQQPDLPIHHQLSEFTQILVHWVSDAIQTSHSLSPSPPAFNLSQHQEKIFFLMSQFFPVSQFFPSCGQSVGVSTSALVLPMNSQDWFPLRWTRWISLLSKGLSRVFSNTKVQKSKLFSTQLSLQSNSHNQKYYWKNRSLD